jgi:hypothetical protein
MLRKTPAFTAVALLTFAHAIGGNAAIFSLIDALLLRPLPIPQADRLTLLRIDADEYSFSCRWCATWNRIPSRFFRTSSPSAATPFKRGAQQRRNASEDNSSAAGFSPPFKSLPN